MERDVQRTPVRIGSLAKLTTVGLGQSDMLEIMSSSHTESGSLGSIRTQPLKQNQEQLTPGPTAVAKSSVLHDPVNFTCSCFW